MKDDSRIRRWLHLDYLCQGCGQLGSSRWWANHDCPERERWLREVQAHLRCGPYFYTGTGTGR